MGFTFQLALGVVLVFVTCCPTGYSGDVVPTTSTTENASLEKSDRNLNLIEKSPKTETELKNVNSNTHKNLTSLKLNKSEPYPKKDEKEKVDFVSSNVVPKQSEEDKENELKKDVGDKRENSSRSIDVTPKHSSDFHGKNVFTSPDMSDPEKYLDHVFEHGSASTEKFYDFDDMELTTPRSEYFDHRYKEAVYSLDKKLTDFDDHEDDSKEMSSESFDATPTAKFMGIQEMQNVVKNNTMGNKHSLHKDTLVMQVKRVNMVAHFNDTEYDDEDEDDKSKGENEKVETTTPRNHFVATTRKSISLTKPPVTNNSYILSNNIETDTVKAINIPIDETTKRVKGEGDNRSSSIDTKEQTIQENQIVPLQATTPSLTTTTTNILTTTVEERPEMTTKPNEYKEITTEVNENLVSTVEPVDESSGTIRIEETLTTTEDMKVIEPTSHEELVTNKDELTTAYESPTNTVRPETVSLTTDTTSKVTETTTKLEPHIEEIITTTPKEGFTLNDQPTSTSFKEVSSTYSAETTTTREDKKTVKTEQPLVASTTDRGDISTTPIDILTTETTVTVQETTTETTTVRYNEKTTENEIQTTEDLQEKTTESEVRTTDHGFRTSKSMAIPTLENDTVTPKELPSTLPPDVEIMSTTVKTTEVPTETVTESASPSSIITEKIPVAITTPLATEPPPVATTGDIFSTLRPRTTKFVSTGTEYPPIPFTTLTDTTPLPENYPTTQKASTMMNIVRIVTVDENRTTLVPRTLSPDVSYPTTDPAEANKSTEEPVITTEEPVITTTEFSTDTTGTEGAVTGDGPEDKKGTIAAIVISTVGAVCLILLAGLLYVMRKRQKRFNYGERCRPVSLDDYSVDNLSVYNSVRRKGNYRQSKRSYGNAAFDDPARPKNAKAYYIATQAPMLNSVDDFWRMIWEQQCKVILMITHFFENGVEKCVDYLPPSEVLDCHRVFGDFQVTLKKRDVKDKYIISSLQLKNLVSNSWREVTHFWYMGWPEKGVPTEANSLIAFLIEARSYMKSSTLDKTSTANGMMNAAQTEANPVVVHCSPGTGRTGVVIACDIAIREFEQTRLVDIPKIVYRIRRDRANAVQTKEQYMFIYKVVSLYATKLTGGALDSL